MPSLRDTQTAFCAAILSGDAASIRHLVRDDGMAPEERVQVYLNNHRVGSLATLQATYPVIERLGGSDWFSQSAAQFLAQFPSRSGDLQHLGEQYPDFLRVHLAETDYAYFADVAALEWAYQLALTAADRAPADLGVLHGVGADDYARLLFVARPAVRLIESRYPIFAIWHANQSSAADHVELRELSPGTFHLLQQFQRGATLGAAAASMATEAPEFDLEVCLREVIGLEAIADIKLCEEPDNQRKLPGESS